MTISVVGTGYVGLVTGTCLADTGNDVICIDIDKEKVKEMQRGIIPIYEPKLEDLFSRNIEAKRLSFTTNLQEGIENAEVIFLALPTPPQDDGSADLSAVLNVAENIGKVLDHFAVIINKSTVPVGTAQKVRKIIGKYRKDFEVISNPEFLREGIAVDDFMTPERIIVGVEDQDKSRAVNIMQTLYKPFFDEKERPLYIMDERSAEMTKYAANAFLATKVAFINEIANLCDAVGADVESIRHGIGADSRIGYKFLQAGIGYGGSCFPKDVQALEKTARDNDYDFQILRAIIDVNKNQRLVLVDKIMQKFGKDLSKRVFALWGLAFKPDTDDIREAPALAIIDKLVSAGATINLFDPQANKHARKRYKNDSRVIVYDDQYDVLNNADALIIATEWQEFKSPDFNKLKELLKKPIIFDGRNVYNPRDVAQSGFEYNCIGRPQYSD